MSRRISAAIVGVVLVTLLLAGTGTFVFARLAIRRQDLSKLELQARKANDLLGSISGSFISNPNGQGATDPATVRRQLLDALSVTGIGEGVIGPNGVYAGDMPTGAQASDLDATALASGQTQAGQHGNVLWAAAGHPVVGAAGRTRVVVTILTQTQERLAGPTFRWFLVSAGIALAIGVAVSFALGRRLGRPVNAAVETTLHIARGDLSARLPQPNAEDDDELAVLSRSINAMGDGLQRAREQERQFLMSVSHDLRTPLTSIRGYAEAIADGATEDSGRAAEVIVAESRRLERLVGDLLDLAKLDADRFELHLAPTDIVDVVAGTVEGFGPELADAHLALHHSLDHADPIVANIDVDRLAQVVANLTANAIAYARSAVWAVARRDGDSAVVEISDDGLGIPAAALPHVFDRLYQGDNQAGRRGRGSGLGLAIVAELSARMGGRCEVRSVEGKGTTFSVRLPLVR